MGEGGERIRLSSSTRPVLPRRVSQSFPFTRSKTKTLPAKVNTTTSRFRGF